MEKETEWVDGGDRRGRKGRLGRTDKGGGWARSRFVAAVETKDHGEF